MKLWLVHLEPFHRHAIRCLGDLGVEVTYACGVPERLLQLGARANCVLHSQWDALAGRLPAGLEGKAGSKPVSGSLLDELAAIEATALSMIDRLNWKSPRVEELRRVYFDYISMWSGLLEFSRPDAVLFHTVPHVGYDYVLYVLCRRAGIRTLIVERTSIPDRLIMLEGLDERPRPPPGTLDVRGGKSTGGNTAASAGRGYYETRDRIFLLRGKERFSEWDLAKLVVRSVASFAYQFIRRPLRLREPIRASVHGLEDRVPSLAQYAWRYLLDTVCMGQLRLYYEKRTLEPDPAADYVYFPLQHQPERSSVPMGLRYSDQLLAIRTLADALPPGWLVYVKEHPRQFTDNHMRSLLARSRRFYDRLQGLPRVRLISARVATEDLLARSKCAATVAGSVGWEAVEKGIPVIVFGVPWYRFCPGVVQAASVADCADALRRIASGEFQVDGAQVRAYRDWISTDGGFKGYPSGIFAHQAGLTPEENGRSYAEEIARRLIAGTRAASQPAAKAELARS